MTVSDLHKSFKMELDKWDSISSVPSFTGREIDYWLNSYTLRLIKTRVSGLNIYRTGAEQSQKRIDDLRSLTVRVTWSGDDVDSDEYFSLPAKSIEYPNDYLIMLSDTARISVGESNLVVNPIECTSQDIDSRLRNSLSEHNLHNGTARPLRISINNRILIIHTFDYRIESYSMVYVRMPEKFNIEASPNDEITFLPNHLLDEIVVGAARLALENISDSRYSTYSQESQLVE